MIGALILQQTLDLTDEETVREYAFDTQWHYALNITEDSDKAKYISLRTLWNNRNIVVENNLDKDMFHAVTDKLAQVFKVNVDKQRIDSVHIKSNMRRLGRIGIFTVTIHKFLTNLKRGQSEQFGNIWAAFPRSSHPNRKRLFLKSAGTFLIWSSSSRIAPL
jgi:hypothetical protein